MKIRISLILALLAIFTPSVAFSQTLQNSEIKLELNPTPPPQENRSNNTNTYQNTSINTQNRLTGENYIITFYPPAQNDKLPLGLTVSSETLNFGTLSSGEPIIRTVDAQIFQGSASSYSLYVAEDRPLTSSNNAQIANTSCDSGNCTYILSDIWNLPLTYGLGYTCSSEDLAVCSKVFAGEKYRRFANLEVGEPLTDVLTGASNSKVSIPVKVNIPATQAPEAYSNILYFLLSPHY